MKGIHNMETMDLKMYYKDNRYSNYTCFISDKYALELKEKYQLNDILIHIHFYTQCLEILTFHI